MTWRGASGEPLAVAGQTSVQRPHSAQLKPSSTCFHVRSSSVATPVPGSSAATPAAGAVSIASGRSALGGGSLPRKTLGMPVSTWKCLVSGSRQRNTSTVTLCSHHPNVTPAS